MFDNLFYFGVILLLSGIGIYTTLKLARIKSLSSKACVRCHKICTGKYCPRCGYPKESDPYHKATRAGHVIDPVTNKCTKCGNIANDCNECVCVKLKFHSINGHLIDLRTNTKVCIKCGRFYSELLTYTKMPRCFISLLNGPMPGSNKAGLEFHIDDFARLHV